MFELCKKEFANLKFAIKGGVVASDANGVIKVSSKEDADILEKTGFVLVSGKEEPKKEAAPAVEAQEEAKEEAPEEKKDSFLKKPRWARKGD